jgi:hypothetical protein
VAFGIFLAAQVAAARGEAADAQPPADAAKERAATAQERRVERAEKRKEALAEKRKEAADRRETFAERRKAREAAKEKTDATPHDLVEKRQSNQARRIDQGIKKGYLTPDEIAKLDAQQKSIETMQQSFEADGKLSGDERRQLHDALDTASRCIWAEKHDTEGNPMPTYRLGKNVFAKDDFTARMEDPNLSKADAKALCRDFNRVVTLKKKLATEDLSDDPRAKLQAEYNDLLNKYFEVRTPAPTPADSNATKV